jgi:hypothetical protein
MDASSFESRTVPIVTAIPPRRDDSPGDMSVPSANYRLQFHGGFTFTQARELVFTGREFVGDTLALPDAFSRLPFSASTQGHDAVQSPDAGAPPSVIDRKDTL